MTWFSLKVQKPCFYAIFDHFCPMGIFSKKSSSVTRYYMWASNTMLSFRKKLMSQCWEKLRTDGRTDGWMEVKIYRTPQAEAGGPIKRPESRFKVKRIPYHFCSKMTKLLWIRYISEKPLISFPCLSWPLSMCKIVKQSLHRTQSCNAGCDILGPKLSVCPKQEFFRISHYWNFYVLLALFIVQNFKKTLTANPELWGWAIFGSKMVDLAQTSVFSEKSLILFSSTNLPISLCQILK